MTLVLKHAFLIPRSTSTLVICPLYEKPLLQLKWNAGQADRAKWVQPLAAIPAGLPQAAHAEDLDCVGEMERLAATYGFEMFRKCYPIDIAFEQAFAACQTTALPESASPVPDMAPTPELLIDEIMELRVPAMGRDRAKVLADANFTVESLISSDARSVATTTGLPINLIRATIEAAKAHRANAPRGAPSAPSEMRVTKMEAPGLTA